MKTDRLATIFDDWDEWEAFRDQLPEDQLSEYIGPSPGYVAAVLGVTRQRIDKLVRQRKIRSVQIPAGEGVQRSHNAYCMIPVSEVTRLLLNKRDQGTLSGVGRLPGWMD